MKNAALVLEGGTQRGVFTAGVLDFLMEKGIEFPYVVSASAGACNAVSFISKQLGRAKACLIGPEQDKRAGAKRLFENRPAMNAEKIFQEYADKQYPFDFAAYFTSKTEHEIVVTNQRTGKSEYLTERRSEERLSLIGKASCSVPVLSPPVELGGEIYCDGTVSDAIPIDRALCKGFDKVLVVLTRQKESLPDASEKLKTFYAIAFRKYQALYNAIMSRSDMYSRQLKTVHDLEKKGKVFVICPEMPEASAAGSFSDRLDDYYQHGYELMQRDFDRLIDFLGMTEGERLAK